MSHHYRAPQHPDPDAQRERQIAAGKAMGIPWAAIVRTTLILLFFLIPLWH